MNRFFWLFLFSIFLAGCGEGMPSFMRPPYPAAKYFAGDLLPLARAVEADDLSELTRRLTFSPDYVRREVGREGMTLLMYAMMNRRKACMKALLAHGWDPNQNTALGNTRLQVQPVGAAARGEDTEILKILLDHGGDPNSRYNDEPATFNAFKTNRYDHLGMLLDGGADINATGKHGVTLVKLLANLNQYEQVAYLIRRGADVHKADESGGTVAFIVQVSDLDPDDDAYKWQQIVKQLLIQRGVTFPVPHPGIAFQARVRQENMQRRAWEHTPEGQRWMERLGAATQSRAPGAANEAMQLRQRAEPAFQAWRKARPGWSPTTNDGSFPLYNSPMDRDLAPDSVAAPVAP